MSIVATKRAIEAVYRIESARLLGGLVRVVKDVGLAEDLAQEALLAAFEVPRARVILMPEGAEAEAVRTRSRWLADACTARGYRLGTRLHLFIWNSERGR